MWEHHGRWKDWSGALVSYIDRNWPLLSSRWKWHKWLQCLFSLFHGDSSFLVMLLLCDSSFSTVTPLSPLMPLIQMDIEEHGESLRAFGHVAFSGLNSGPRWAQKNYTLVIKRGIHLQCVHSVCPEEAIPWLCQAYNDHRGHLSPDIPTVYIQYKILHNVRKNG